MFIESITLSGFRSFYRTQITSFDPGLTAIIGPEGCGKSNLIQAILWAFGHSTAATTPETVCSRPSGSLSAKGAKVDLDFQGSPLEKETAISRTLSVNGLWATFEIDGIDCSDRTPPEEFTAAKSRLHFITSQDEFDLAFETLKMGDLFLIDLSDRPSPTFFESLRALAQENHQIIAATNIRDLVNIADQAIGVTMEEYGVSKLVPMRLRE